MMTENEKTKAGKRRRPKNGPLEPLSGSKKVKITIIPDKITAKVHSHQKKTPNDL